MRTAKNAKKQGQRGAKNTPKKLIIDNSERLKSKKGSLTQPKPKKGVIKRFFEVKIRLSAEDYSRGLPYFHESKYLSRYMQDAYLEKVIRTEGFDKRAKAAMLKKDMEFLLPIIRELHSQGLLKFLFTGGGKNGDT